MNQETIAGSVGELVNEAGFFTWGSAASDYVLKSENPQLFIGGIGGRQPRFYAAFMKDKVKIMDISKVKTSDIWLYLRTAGKPSHRPDRWTDFEYANPEFP